MYLYPNDKGDLFINVGPADDDTGIQSGFITLKRSDVAELIKILQDVEPEINEE